MNKTLERSIAAGGVVVIGFFFVTVGSIFMVMGDGSAPWITHSMLALCEVPIKLFGLKKDLMVVIASVFWGAVAFVGALVVLGTVSAFEPYPRAQAAARTLLRTSLFLAVLAMVFLV